MNEGLFGSDADATPLSEEEKQGLIPGITTRAELNELERHNILEARVWAMRRRQLQRADLVSDVFARELHRRMFNGVWRWAGKYRTTEKNLGWEVHRLTEGVRNACDDARAWLEFKTYSVEEAAVRFHHRLVLIHPWANGNGRHARLMADVVCAAHGGAELSWGANADLIGHGEIRRRYIAAVREADGGNFTQLIAFARS